MSYPEIPVPVEAAARRLRARGFGRPECRARARLPDPRSVASPRAAALDEARRREAAVDAA